MQATVSRTLGWENLDSSMSRSHTQCVKTSTVDKISTTTEWLYGPSKTTAIYPENLTHISGGTAYDLIGETMRYGVENMKGNAKSEECELVSYYKLFSLIFVVLAIVSAGIMLISELPKLIGLSGTIIFSTSAFGMYVNKVRWEESHRC